MKQNYGHVRSSQLGMASVMIVFVIMIVIAITVIGFATIIRRSQRAALDRHLSSRAYYAAESGLNMAADALRANSSLTAATCNAAAGLNYQLDPNTSTEVSCLTIDPSQDELLYTISQDHGQVIPVNTTGPLTALLLSWQSTTANNSTSYASCVGGAVQLPASGSWGCQAPLIRVDLVPLPAVFGRATLDNTVFTTFLYPHFNGSSTTDVSYGSSIGPNQGTMTSTVHCQAPHPSATYHCNARIAGIPNWTNAYMRVSTYYRDSLLSVRAQGATPLELIGAQATIDSTGRAQDVVRRIQARVPLVSETPLPDSALQVASGICKLYQVVPGASPSVIQNGVAAGFGVSPCD